MFPYVAYFTAHTVRVASVPPATQFRVSAMLLLWQWGVTPMITNFVKICQSFQTFKWRTDRLTRIYSIGIAWGSHNTILSFLGTQVVKTSVRTSQRTQSVYTIQIRTNQLMQLPEVAAVYFENNSNRIDKNIVWAKWYTLAVHICATALYRVTPLSHCQAPACCEVAHCSRQLSGR
jgi:hypothetical protein